MKQCLLFSFFTLLSFTQIFAQNFTGQWKGEFIDKSTSYINWGGDKCEYVLELETKGSTISGYSYTYFTDGGKRFYTICKLVGFIDRKRKYVEVRETERTKTNVPVHIRNCFQVHKLSYKEVAGEEFLQGNWIPASNQEGDCGYGYTLLSRRVLRTNIPRTNPANVKKGTTVPSPPVAKATIPKKPPVKKPQAPNDVVLNRKVQDQQNIDPTNSRNGSVTLEKVSTPAMNYKNRNTNLLKTIEVSNESVRVDLYDNGEIDGDSVSLFYNGKMLVSKQRLSDRAITFNLEVESAGEMNELVMYAENLGTIPPNTALMIVTDGKKRYEVRITSDLQKSGTINFIRRDNN